MMFTQVAIVCHCSLSCAFCIITVARTSDVRCAMHTFYFTWQLKRQAVIVIERWPQKVRAKVSEDVQSEKYRFAHEHRAENISGARVTLKYHTRAALMQSYPMPATHIRRRTLLRWRRVRGTQGATFANSFAARDHTHSHFYVISAGLWPVSSAHSSISGNISAAAHHTGHSCARPRPEWRQRSGHLIHLEARPGHFHLGSLASNIRAHCATRWWIYFKRLNSAIDENERPPCVRSA